MAQQLDLLGTEERIIPMALHTEMQQSYLEYAMSVIVGRALPDVRDGLKPVHRRILFAMHELGLTPDRPFRKCARVVGDVLGKYHPHGDQSVYDALVRLVQDFSSRYPLLGGHGNFGSVDNDPPAAMRYTETRLSQIGHSAVLGEIGTATVDFTGNFDNSQQEPTVLPVEFPLLVVNGCSGIAVGMTTNIPPHNLGEIIDGLIALIDKPELPDHELWTIIPGPDFPTGGEIVGNMGICEAYRSGRGIIPLRGVVHLEAAKEKAKLGKSRKRRDSLIVTELPFQVNKAALIERIAELVNGGKLDGIADLRDESDREGMRIVIELKRDSNYDQVLENLYRQTSLQSNFGAIFLALVDGLPKQLSLRQSLQEFLKFREETLTRQYSNDLEHFEQRAHLVNGLLLALGNLDGIIEILRHAPDGSTAKVQMVEQFELSETQADAILAMPMRRLTGMERQNLAQEALDLQEKIGKLEKLLGDRKELLKSMKKDLRALRKQHADERRTKIIDAQPILEVIQRIQPKPPAPPKVVPPPIVRDVDALEVEDLTIDVETPEPAISEDFDTATEPTAIPAIVPNPPAQQELTQEDFTVAPVEPIQHQPIPVSLPKAAPAPKAPRPQQMNLIPIAPTTPQQVHLEFTGSGNVRRVDRPELSYQSTADLILEHRSLMTDQEIVVIASNGKAYAVKVGNIPPVTDDQSPGESLIPMISGLSTGDEIIRQIQLGTPTTPSAIMLVTAQGRIKRLPITELTSTTSRGMALMKLQPDDRLVFAAPITNATELVIGTSLGRLLRLTINNDQIPLQGRPSQGVQAMRVGQKESLVVCLPVLDSDSLMLLTSLGYGKQMPVLALRRIPVGSIGDQALRFKDAHDYLLHCSIAKPTGSIVVTTTQSRKLSVDLDKVPFLGKEGGGDKLFNLKAEESLQAVLIEESKK
jgi:DNA gyrase subunit A